MEPLTGPPSALSYGRIIGANDRISLGHIGNRGRELASIASDLKGSHKVEITAVCDLWKVNRERAVEKTEQMFARTLKILRRPSRPQRRRRRNHLHRRLPARAHPQTSRRSWQGCLPRKGHGKRPRRREGRPRRRRTDKKSRDRVELPRPALARPPGSEAYPRRRYGLAKMVPRQTLPPTSGIAGQWMSHGIDMVHHPLDDHFPKSVVAHGGVFSWPEGRETPNTFHALLGYPQGFLVSN